MSPGAHKSSLAKLVVDDVSKSFKTPAGVFEALAPVSLSIPRAASSA